MKKFFMSICLFLVVGLFASACFAQTSTSPDQDFLAQLIAVVKSFGGLEWAGKVAAGCLLLIAAMKVTFLQPLWAKLGAFQIWAAPLLGLIAGVLALHGTTQMSLAGIMAYVGAGAGAVYVHEILDAIKKIPGLGSIYVSIINAIETSALGSNPPA